MFQLIGSILALLNLLFKTVENHFSLEVKKLNQDILFVLEIKIYGTIRHTRLPGDMSNG